MGERKQEQNKCCRMEKFTGKVGEIQRNSDSNRDGERGRDGRDRARKREGACSAIQKGNTLSLTMKE